MKKNSGFSSIAIIIVLAILLIGASAVAYYVLNGKNPLNYGTNYTPLPSGSNYYYPSPSPLSPGNDTQTIQSELDYTTEGSVESDLNQLDSEASSL